jgi:hypothetical protein
MNLPVYSTIVNKLIRGYFRLYFFNKFINNKFISYKSKNKSMNKIYISKPEIKHTNMKSIITIYLFNREKLPLQKNLSKYTARILNILKYVYINKYNINKKLLIFLLYEEIILLRRYILKMSLNKYKFEKAFLNKLNLLLSNIYKKKVEFNLINLKSSILNSDIFTEILGLKLKDRKFNISKMINIVLNKVKLPKENTIKERTRILKSKDINNLEDNYRNIYLDYLLNKKNLLKDSLTSLINKLYFNRNHTLYNNYIRDFIFNSIKYKNMNGIRLQAKGRLTKRYKAQRASYKISTKGGLKNIDSSFKGLSTIVYRGNFKSNVEYSLHSNKRRIGAFAIKG